jgi:hypothetical protein
MANSKILDLDAVDPVELTDVITLVRGSGAGANKRATVQVLGDLLTDPSTGVTTFAGLTDRTSADIPTINLPLATALAGKADFFATGTDITATGNLSASAHANRLIQITGAGGYTLTIRTDSAGGWTDSDELLLINDTAGAITIAGGTATLSAPTGYKNTLVVGEIGTFIRTDVDTWRSTTVDPAGGVGVGTVTSVSVTTANGVSGSVATATTTPAITLTLGAITPTSVNSVVLSGSATPTLAVSGTTTVSGANTGDQSLAGLQPLDSDLTTIASLTATTDNFMQAKSSAWASRTVAQVNTDLQGTGLIALAAGFRQVPANSQSAAYTTVAADSGYSIDHPSSDANARTFTIDSNANVAYPVGTCISFSNMTANVVTIAITSDTMYLAGTGTTGSRSLAQYGTATARKLTSTTWIISGIGLT